MMLREVIMPIYIRVSKPERIHKLLIEFEECFPDLIERVGSLHQFSNKLSKASIVIVMKCEDEVVGLCSYYSNDYQSYTGYISLIGIKEEFRGNGNGKKLLNYVIDDCRKCGMQQIKLEVNADNNRAISFYVNNGFQIESKAREESYYMSRLLY